SFEINGFEGDPGEPGSCVGRAPGAGLYPACWQGPSERTSEGSRGPSEQERTCQGVSPNCCAVPVTAPVIPAWPAIARAPADRGTASERPDAGRGTVTRDAAERASAAAASLLRRNAPGRCTMGRAILSADQHHVAAGIASAAAASAGFWALGYEFYSSAAPAG